MLEKAFNRACSKRNKSKGQGISGEKLSQLICSYEQNFKKKKLLRQKLVSVRIARKRRRPDQGLVPRNDRSVKIQPSKQRRKTTV